MDLKILKLLLNKLVNAEIVMGCRRVCGNIFSPPGMAVLLSITLWALLAVSVVYLWIDDSKKLAQLDIKLLPVYIHALCLFTSCITVTFLTYTIFFRNSFESWFSTLGFLFYILAELILIVNTLTMEFDLKHYIECIVLFILLCIYTQVVSWHQSLYKEYLRRQHEEYINKQTSSVTYRRGKCERIPLKGPLPPSKTLVSGRPGPSTITKLLPAVKLAVSRSNSPEVMLNSKGTYL